ncbi:MAG: LLM class flavin-dependent oxidoreductase [Chromatiales bacterium]|jgi:alkanesulfonate monooxygenase SsuD/methylene tetrahydromethanopterin reductase-like flavin-dependent oxidoreductase (luciferase family)|nr:LLM class flavin-dependent oxidoreductase [Chromatiales bacterium]
MKLTRNVAIGVHVPTVMPMALPSKLDYVNFFQACESLGFDSLWFEDRLLHDAPLAEPLTMLAVAATVTDNVLLGSAVVALNLRQAPLLARQLTTLDHLSGGRLVAGLSIGGRPEEYAAYRMDTPRRVAAFNENLSTLRALLAGQPVVHDGELYRLEGALVRPASIPPILIGGVVEAALKRAGRLADGWVMAPFGSVKDFERSWSIVLEAAEQAGRDPNQMVASRLLYVAIDDDKHQGLRALKQFLHTYYGPSYEVEKHAIFGSTTQIADKLREQIDAGITHLMLGVPTLSIEALTQIADEVIPALRN